MEAILIKGGGGGVTSDDVTAKANDVLKGTSTLTSDSNDEVTEGTLELTGDAQAGDVLAGSTSIIQTHIRNRQEPYRGTAKSLVV